MDTTAKLIICVILGAFYAPTVSAYNLHGPEVYDNLQIVDGELHFKRAGGSSLAYPNAGISKEIPVNTSKGNFLVPLEKTLPISNAKLGKAATRFLKSAPFIGTGLAIYDTVCDLTEICVSTEDNGLIYREGPNYLGSIENPNNCSVHPYPSNNYVTIDGKLYEYKTFPSTPHGCSSPPKENFSSVNNCSISTQTLPCGFYQPHRRLVSSLPESTERPLTESDWTAAETKLNAQPQQTAEALYDSDAPIPVLASTQSAPVTQQIAQTSTQTKDALGNVTGTQTATTTVKVEDTSTTNNITYNITETTTITNYDENNEVTGTQTSTSDNQPPEKPPGEQEDITMDHGGVPEVPLLTQTIDVQEELDNAEQPSWSGGNCPADIEIGVYGLEFSLTPFCNFADGLRPIVLMLGAFISFFILSGAKFD